MADDNKRRTKYSSDGGPKWDHSKSSNPVIMWGSVSDTSVFKKPEQRETDSGWSQAKQRTEIGVDEHRIAAIEAAERGIQALAHELLDALVEPVSLPAVSARVLLGVFPFSNDQGLVVVFRCGEGSLIVP